MAKLVRVESHSRQVSGKTQKVTAHIRKVHDSVEGLQAKKGINTTVTQLESAASGSVAPKVALKDPVVVPTKVSREEASREVLARRRSPEVMQVVRDTMKKAEDIEPDVTSALERVALKAGGRMVGLKERLKTEESLSRKVGDGSSKRRQDPASFAKEHVVDALRYTMVSSAENNIETARRAIAQLESEGHKVVEEDIYNYWGEDSVYHGINIAVTAPNGLRWEVQIHTEDSLIRKRHSHFWYDLMRDETQPDDVVSHAREQSKLAWMGLQRPPGWNTLGSQQGGTEGGAYVGGVKRKIPASAKAPHLSASRDVEDEEAEEAALSASGAWW